MELGFHSLPRRAGTRNLPGYIFRRGKREYIHPAKPGFLLLREIRQIGNGKAIVTALFSNNMLFLDDRLSAFALLSTRAAAHYKDFEMS